MPLDTYPVGRAMVHSHVWIVILSKWHLLPIIVIQSSIKTKMVFGSGPSLLSPHSHTCTHSLDLLLHTHARTHTLSLAFVIPVLDMTFLCSSTMLTERTLNLNIVCLFCHKFWHFSNVTSQIFYADIEKMHPGPFLWFASKQFFLLRSRTWPITMSNKEKVDSFGPQLALVVPFGTPRAKYGPVMIYNIEVGVPNSTLSSCL